MRRKYRFSRLSGSCRLMLELNKNIENIERAHNIKLNDKEVEKLKCMLCSYVCNGRCQACFVSVLQ